MIAKTTLKTVGFENFIPREVLDKSFNRAGLCAYCSHKITCVLSCDCGLVYECDDYETGEDASPAFTFSALALSMDDEDEDYGMNGLCAECQKRDICLLKNINGGVWHCDEFI